LLQIVLQHGVVKLVPIGGGSEGQIMRLFLAPEDRSQALEAVCEGAQLGPDFDSVGPLLQDFLDVLPTLAVKKLIQAPAASTAHMILRNLAGSKEASTACE
jgi:hypothetical protein